jgi:hypothetical protein
MAYDMVKVTTESDWRDYHSLRREVLWEARGRDQLEPPALTILGMPGVPLG